MKRLLLISHWNLRSEHKVSSLRMIPNLWSHKSREKPRSTRHFYKNTSFGPKKVIKVKNIIDIARLREKNTRVADVSKIANT